MSPRRSPSSAARESECGSGGITCENSKVARHTTHIAYHNDNKPTLFKGWRNIGYSLCKVADKTRAHTHTRTTLASWKDMKGAALHLRCPPLFLGECVECERAPLVQVALSAHTRPVHASCFRHGALITAIAAATATAAGLGEVGHSRRRVLAMRVQRRQAHNQGIRQTVCKQINSLTAGKER